MTQEELKERFAGELFKDPSNPLKAALAVYGENNLPMASRIAIEWPKDELVISCMNKLKTINPLPTKEQIADKLWAMANDKNMEGKDRVSSLKVLSEICGYIEQKGTKIDVNNVNNPKVMVVRDHGDLDEWERKLEDQQRKLVNG